MILTMDKMPSHLSSLGATASQAGAAAATASQNAPPSGAARARLDSNPTSMTAVAVLVALAFGAGTLLI